ARRNDKQECRVGSGSGEPHYIPDDVSLWDLLPSQPNADVPTECSSRTAIVLSDRWAESGNDLQQLWSSPIRSRTDGRAFSNSVRSRRRLLQVEGRLRMVEIVAKGSYLSVL